MDSRLLNAYHDDPYESYENNVSEIWSTDNIEMELEHTLDGILPMRALEAENEAYCNVFYADEHFYGDKENKTNALAYNNFEEQLKINAEGENETQKVNIFNVAKFDEDDVKSQCSNTSFRTRTDSSSIGDYESHTSDYDDEDEDMNEVEYIDDFDVEDGKAVDDSDGDEANFNQIVDRDNEGYAAYDDCAIEALEADDLLTDLPGLNHLFVANGDKQRTFSTNTIDSDVDYANFDLAEFITKDDHLLDSEAAKATKSAKVVRQTVTANNISTIPSKTKNAVQKFIAIESAADSDSDAIVDVETVEQEDIKKRVSLLKNNITVSPEDNLTFVDNVKADPEWNPKESKPKCNKPSPSVVSTSAGKCQKQRGKLNAQNQQISNKFATKVGNKKQILKCTQTNVLQNRHAVRKGGKNLSLLKRDCESIEDKSKIKKDGKDIAFYKHDSHSINKSMAPNNTICKIINNNYSADNSLKNKPTIVETEKRKLNLDEYKRRLNGSNNSKNQMTEMQTSPITPKPTNLSLNQSPTKIQKPHSEAVISVVKTLKEQQEKQQIDQKIDPITLARNKVLRMQELKRAQQMKIIDSKILAKVPKVTKLLPLQEIIKDTAYAIKSGKNEKTKAIVNSNLDNHPDYEKIVMVSVACNTVLTFSPNDNLPNVPLLENIKCATNEHNVKISHNSLITSIQDAVVKQSLPKIEAISTIGATTLMTPTPDSSQIQCQQHGEDKIIMHLRKDRIRDEHNTRQCTIEIQTDFQAAFPTLPLPKYSRKLRYTRRKYRKHNDAANSSEGESSQSDDENVDDVKVTTEYANSVNGGSIAGYSSRSSRRHRSSVSSSYSESGHQHRRSRRRRSSRDSKRKSNYSKSMRNKTKRSNSSSSSASSLSDYSERSRSRSRNRSGRRSMSRSRSPFYARHDSSYGERNVSKPAVEERRIVYVGRVEEETTKEILRRKFLVYGSIRQITLHYKENGLKYGFVTFDRSQDAFAAIDNSARDAQINMYDISFGGRRAFCRTSYADLDNAGINNYHSYVFPQTVAPPKQEDSFEALLKKVKARLDASKSTSTTAMSNDKP